MKSIQMNTVVCSFFFSSFSPVCISWNIKLKNQNTKNVVNEKREENEIKYAPWKLDLLALLRFNFSLVFFVHSFSWARLCAVFFIGFSPLFKWDCQLIWFDIYELFFMRFHWDLKLIEYVRLPGVHTPYSLANLYCFQHSNQITVTIYLNLNSTQKCSFINYVLILLKFFNANI